MAVDSHDDSQYELLIDTVNNNSKRKNSVTSTLSSDLNDHSCDNFPYATIPVLLDASRAEGGSWRRKRCCISKGITIEEFLEAEESYQLTPIDRLLLKNKIALARDQMKKTKAKPAKECTLKKEDRKNGGGAGGGKLVCSKIATKRKNAEKRATHCNGNLKIVSRVKNGCTSVVVFRDGLKSSKKHYSSSDSEKTRRSRYVGAKEAKKKCVDDKNDSSGRVSLLKRRSLQKESRGKSMMIKKKQPLELKRLKTCLNYQTRSGNKERLRSGRPRIFKDKKESAVSSKAATKRAKPGSGIVGNATEAPAEVPPVPESVDGRTSLKRAIKQEPLDDECGIRDKRKKMECDDGEGEAAPKMAINRSSNFVRVKQEVSRSQSEQQRPNIVEINVNMSVPIVPSASAPAPVQVPAHGPARERSDNSIKSNVKRESAAIAHVVGYEWGGSEGSSKQQRRATESSSSSMTTSKSESKAAFTKNGIPSCADDKENGCEFSRPVADERLSVFQSSVPTETVRGGGADETIRTKESIFNALGLQSIEKVNHKPKEKEAKDKENYTGTLKAVIKVDKGCRRIEMKQQELNAVRTESTQKENVLSFYSKMLQTSQLPDDGGCKGNVCSNNAGKATTEDNFGMEPLCLENDTADKCDDMSTIAVPQQNTVPFVANTNANGTTPKLGDATSTPGGAAIADAATKDKNKVVEPLVVPEKSSSFSIHPDRLCSDVCKYCFGKFGSLDTPCHVAQLKNSDRQKKILLCEPNLKMDTCLCDACFRFVDRKANRPPPIKRKAMRRSSMNQRSLCAVQNCNQAARHYGKRKWRLKMGKKIANLSFDASRRNSRMSFGLCTNHYREVDLQTLCGICKKRLNRNDMYSIRSEVNGLNEILTQDCIPITLLDNTLLCKQCHHCMSLRIKYGSVCNMSPSNRQYYQSFRQQILHQHNISTDNHNENIDIVNVDDDDDDDDDDVEPTAQQSSSLAAKSKRADEYECKASGHNVGIREIASLLKPLEAEHSNDKNSTHIQLKFGNLNIGKLSNLNIGQQNTQPKSSKQHHGGGGGGGCGARELPLTAAFTFESDATGDGGGQKNWEKCVSTIQFDQGTKKLWQELQKPYGNQSSFIRHLIMLEKYWRCGALTLSDRAEPAAVKYINSVKNRIESLETFTASTSSSVVPKNRVICSLPSPKVLPPATVSSNCARVCNGDVVAAAGRHASAPPPLLKLSSIPTSSFVMRQIQVSNVKSIPEVSFQVMKSQQHDSSRDALPVAAGKNHHTLPPPPVLKRMTSVAPYAANRTPPLVHRHASSSLQPPQRAKHSVSVGSSNASSALSVSFLKKTTGHHTGGYVTNVPSSTVSVNFPSKQFASPLMKTDHSINISNSSSVKSLLIPKLPKALTVTQIEEPSSVRLKQESKSSLVLAPFLVGEKPSVSVFREVAK